MAAVANISSNGLMGLKATGLHSVGKSLSKDRAWTLHGLE